MPFPSTRSVKNELPNYQSPSPPRSLQHTLHTAYLKAYLA